jgi:hypothetical protein
MSDSMWKKLLVAAAVVVIAGTFVGNGTLSIGQEAKAQKAEKKAKGRLPPYFAGIVTEAQRTAIYEIQAKYAKERDALENQLEELRSIESGEIEAVLDAEQKEKLKKAREEAAAKKKKKSPETKAAETKPAEAAPKPKKAA